MPCDELRLASIRLYGPGLSTPGYIRALAQDLRRGETDVRRLWYGITGPGLPDDVALSLERLEARWNFAQQRHPPRYP